MLQPWNEFVAFLNTGLVELLETEFAQVRYGDIGMATALSIAVGIVAVAAAARLMFRQRKHVRQHSGHVIEHRHTKRLWVRTAHSLPKALVGGALALMLFAAADPFLTATEEVSGFVESRVRVDLVDTSGSMAWEFPDTGKSKAEIARDAHLRFLDMRTGARTIASRSGSSRPTPTWSTTSSWTTSCTTSRYGTLRTS